MNLPNPNTFLQQMMRQNPNLMQNPQAKNMIDILQSGDAKKGEEMANNLLQSFGMTKEQAMQMVAQRFGFR